MVIFEFVWLFWRLTLIETIIYFARNYKNDLMEIQWNLAKPDNANPDRSRLSELKCTSVSSSLAKGFFITSSFHVATLGIGLVNFMRQWRRHLIGYSRF